MPSRIVNLATPWRLIQSFKAAFSVAVAFAAASSGYSSYPLMIPYTCCCSRSRAISVARCAQFVPSNLLIVIVIELISHNPNLVSQLSILVVSRTLRETSSIRRQKHCGMRGTRLTCGDAFPWQSLPLDKRKWKCLSSFPFYTPGLITGCKVACARVAECASAYANICPLYNVTRHVSST